MQEIVRARVDVARGWCQTCGPTVDPGGLMPDTTGEASRCRHCGAIYYPRPAFIGECPVAAVHEVDVEAPVESEP